MRKTQLGLGIAKNMPQNTSAPLKKIMGIAIMPLPPRKKTLLGILMPPKPAAKPFRMPMPEPFEKEW